MPITSFNTWVLAYHSQEKEFTTSNIWRSLLANTTFIWPKSISPGCVQPSWMSDNLLVLFFIGQTGESPGSPIQDGQSPVLFILYRFTGLMVSQTFTIKSFHPFFGHNLTSFSESMGGIHLHFWTPTYSIHASHTSCLLLCLESTVSCLFAY